MFKRFFSIFRLYFIQSFKTELAYRLQILQRFIGVSLAMTGILFFWGAVSKNMSIGNYTPQSMLFYFFIVSLQDFLFVTGDEFARKVGNGIRSGKLSAALIQPFPYLGQVFASGFAGLWIRLLIVVPLFFVLRFTVLNDFIFENLGSQVGFYLLALFLGALVSLTCLTITGLFAFDLTHAWAPAVTFMAFYCLLSGCLFPADQVSGLFKTCMEWSPFYYMQGFPILILLGRLSSHEMGMGFLRLGCVLTCSLIILVVMWRRGVKKFEAIGL